MSSLILPALLVGALLAALCRHVDVYTAFVRGAKEGLLTLAGMAPYLAAILTVTALWRQTGLMEVLTRALAPLLTRLGLPAEVIGVVLLRPLSASAALAAARETLMLVGADSRAGRMVCVICGASETVFFTGALYLGAAGVRRGRYAVPVAMAAYAAGVLAAAAVA